jgi:hypothetical protein
MFTMLSAFAEFERSMIVERINYGLDRARKQDKKLGGARSLCRRIALLPTVRKAAAIGGSPILWASASGRFIQSLRPPSPESEDLEPSLNFRVSPHRLFNPPDSENRSREQPLLTLRPLGGAGPLGTRPGVTSTKLHHVDWIFGSCPPLLTSGA